MQDAFIQISAAATLGLALLCGSLILTRPTCATSDWPLLAVFSAITIIVLPALAGALAPQVAHLLAALSLAAHLGLAPALWLYVEALTSETEWRPDRRHAWHVLPAASGSLAVLLVLLVPALDLDAMWNRGERPSSPYSLFVALFVSP